MLEEWLITERRGVVHENIDPAEGLAGGSHQPLDVLGNRHVGRQGKGGASRVGERRRNRAGALLEEVVDHDRGATLRERLDDPLADAMTTPGHQRDLACQLALTMPVHARSLSCRGVPGRPRVWLRPPWGIR